MGLADVWTANFVIRRWRVSILVLMDGARRHLRLQLRRMHIQGFNPCFDGWGSPTEFGVVSSSASCKFQSLF